MQMKKQSRDIIAEGPCSSSKVVMTIGIDLGDVWSHYCTLNQEGEVVDRGSISHYLGWGKVGGQ